MASDISYISLPHSYGSRPYFFRARVGKNCLWVNGRQYNFIVISKCERGNRCESIESLADRILDEGPVSESFCAAEVTFHARAVDPIQLPRELSLKLYKYCTQCSKNLRHCDYAHPFLPPLPLPFVLSRLEDPPKTLWIHAKNNCRGAFLFERHDMKALVHYECCNGPTCPWIQETIKGLLPTGDCFLCMKLSTCIKKITLHKCHKHNTVTFTAAFCINLQKIVEIENCLLCWENRACQYSSQCFTHPISHLDHPQH